MAGTDYLKFTIEDTFASWLTKHNQLVDSFGTTVNFEYQHTVADGRNVKVSGGKIRDGATVTVLAEYNTLLAQNTDMVLGIGKSGTSVLFQLFSYGSQPESYFIPLYRFKTNTNNVSEYTDMRTSTAFGNGAGGDSSGAVGPVQLYNRDITSNFTIPDGQNALSVSPVVADGVTVTVPDGSVWVIV